MMSAELSRIHAHVQEAERVLKDLKERAHAVEIAPDDKQSNIPTALIENTAVSAGAALFLIRFFVRGGYMRASLRSIAEEVGMSHSRVDHYIEELEEAGQIQHKLVEQNGHWITEIRFLGVQ